MALREKIFFLTQDAETVGDVPALCKTLPYPEIFLKNITYSHLDFKYTFNTPFR